MTSTVSFKDKFKQAFSFFQWELKSCAGTLTIYSILTAVFMVIILTMCLVIGAQANANADNLNEMYIGGSTAFSNTILPDLTELEDYSALTLAKAVFQILSFNMVQFMTVIFTVIYTVKVFGYLHNKRQTDMYGSMPVSRITLFFSKSATAFVFSVVPAMVFLGIIAIISIVLGVPLLNYNVMVFVRIIMGSLACISAYGLIAVCCGTTINSIIMFIVVSVAYPLSAFFVKGVMDSFYIGSSSDYLNNSFIMKAFCPLGAYDGTNIIYWLVFTTVCLAASAYLVRNRKAERVQSSFAYYLPCHIVKVLVSFLAGMFLGVLFGSMNVFGYGFAGFVFGFILASIPAFIVCHLIFYHGFHNIIRTSVSLGVLIVVAVGAMALVNFDVTGYNKFSMNVDDIESAGFIYGEDCYYDSDKMSFSDLLKNASTDYYDKTRISNIVQLNKYVVEKNNYTSSEKFVGTWVAMLKSAANFDSCNYQAFSYKMKDGSVITREYDTTDFDPMYDRALAIDETTGKSIYDLIEEIVCTKEYQEKYSGFMNANCNAITEMSVCDALTDFELSSSYTQYTIENTQKYLEDREKILEAYKKDFEADSKDIEWALHYVLSSDVILGGQSGLRSGYYEYKDYICVLEIYYQSDASLFGIQEQLVVPSSYTNTIKALKDIGILNSDSTANTDSPYYYE